MLYKTAHASRELLFNEAETMESFTKALENNVQPQHGEQVKEIIHELELTEPSYMQAEQTEPAGDKFFTRSDVQLVIAQEMEIGTTSTSKEKIKQVVEDTLINLFHVGYTAGKEGVKTPILNHLENALIHIVQQDQLDTLLIWNVDVLTESERFMEGLTKHMIMNK